jgi:hypothetical protein
MSYTALQTVELSDAPKLRLLPSRNSSYATSMVPDLFPTVTRGAAADEQRASLRLVEDTPQQERPVLIAGRDASDRQAVLNDLVETMPPETAFEQAGAFWEVLVQAPTISMVILSGDLDDVPAESLLAMLAHRHPDLPVVSLDASSAHDEAHAYV